MTPPHKNSANKATLQAVEMTEERCDYYIAVAGKILDILHADLETPGEAFCVLNMLVETFRETFHIKDMKVVTLEQSKRIQ